MVDVNFDIRCVLYLKAEQWNGGVARQSKSEDCEDWPRRPG